MTAEELKKVEDIVNEQISKGLDVIVKNMPIEEAKKTGAQALFGEKIRRHRTRRKYERFLHRVLRRYPCEEYF